MPPLTSEEILDNLNANAIATVAGLTTAINTAIAAMNALKDKAAEQTDKTDEIFAAAPADVTLPSGDIVPNFAKVRADLNAAITAFTSIAYLEADAQAVDSAKLEGKTLATITSDIKTDIIGAAPAILDTLGEIAAALDDDDTAINALLSRLSTLSSDLSTLSTALDDKAAVVHEHDSRYYTKTEVDAVVADLESQIAAVEAQNPVFTTTAVTAISGSSMTANGTISDFGESTQTLQYRFIYGTTTDMTDGATAWTSATTIEAVSASLSGLSIPSVVYYIAMQVRDTQKPNLGGVGAAELTANYVSATTGTEVEDTDTFIHIEGTGGTGYIAMNSTNVPSLTNASIVSNEIVGSGAFKAISKPFDQDAGQGDFSFITPLTKIKANKLTVDGTSTASVPVFTSGYDNLLSTGSKIIVDDGGTIKEVVAGTVTKTGSSPTYKYTLASTTPTLTNNPSSAYVGGQQTYIYSADNFAGKTLTVDASTTHQTMTVKSGSTAAIPIFVGTTSGLITTGQHILVEDGTWKDVVAGTVTIVNPSAGVYEYTIAGTTPALDSTPTSAKATGKLVLTTSTTGVITSGDTVSLNSGTGGTNQNVVFGSVVESSGGTISTSTVDIFGDNSCIALYQFEGNANDTRGTYNGTATNVTYAAGKFGQCAVFNGSSSKINNPTKILNSLPSDNYSISVFVKANSFHNGTIFNGAASSNNRHSNLKLNSDGTVVFNNQNTNVLISSVTSSTKYAVNTWILIVGTYSTSAGSKLYINTVLDGTAAYVTLDRANYAWGEHFGAFNDGTFDFFNGSIDQARFFNRAITASEVTVLYHEMVTSYTCTSPTPSLVQIPTTANKGELVVPTLTGFTKATDTISYVYAKTALPANSRSLAVRVDGTIADAVTSLEGVIYV